MYSSYCKKSFTAPGIGGDRNLLRRALLKIMPWARGSVIFPAEDILAMNLPYLRDDLKNYILTVAQEDIVETLINKRRFYESLTKQDVPHPITVPVEDYEAARETSQSILYPALIRPVFSYDFKEIFQKKGFIVRSAEDLLEHFKLTQKAELEVMIQEIIPGPPTNHIFLDGYMDKNANPKAFFARQRLRMWPLTFGNGTLCKSMAAHQVKAQKELLFKYLKSINYSGIFSAEFKKDTRDDTFKLLEITSRTSSWFSTLSAKCGVNIMLIAYLNAIGKDTKYTEDYEAGYKWLLLGEDIRAATKMILDGKLTILEWLSTLRRAKLECFPFAKDDLFPFISSFFARSLLLWS